MFVQITGVLILAAGVPRAFEHRDFDIVFVGYLVMRVGLVTPLAARRPPRPERPHDRAPVRRWASRCAWSGGSGVALIGWPVWAFVVMGVAELLVPAVGGAGRTHTPWHPEHIAERYGLFTIIVLGETILSSSVAFQAVVDERTGDVTVVLTAVGALLTVFSMWWIYFAKPAAPRRWCRTGSRSSGATATTWCSRSAAAVGAGVAVMVDRVTGRAHIVRHRRGGVLHDPGDPLRRSRSRSSRRCCTACTATAWSRCWSRSCCVGRGDVHRPAGAAHRARARRRWSAVLLVLHERASH